MSSKVENVDIAFEMITEAVESFQGFLLGIPEGDTYQRLTGDMNTNGPEDEDSLKKIRAARRVLSNICDRTNGGYALSQIGDDFKTLFTAAYGDDTEGVLSISFDGSERFDISENLASSGGTDVGDAYLSYALFGINEVLKYADPSKFSDRELISGSYGTSDNLSDSEVLNQVPPTGLNSIVTVTSAPGEGIDKFSHPSLGAVIIKDPVFGFNSRNANHFPVFLSAVTPLEISRCTPYLDVKILTKNRSGTKENKMSIHNFLRHEGSNETFERAQPVGEAYTETLGDVDFNYMDIFTSPQTMVNPNINRSQKGFEDIYVDVVTSAIIGEGTGDKPFEYTNVRDPFQPFMTLLSFNTSIAGIGHGLLATKKAHLKIKLHDKTRIKDLSAILSPNEFSQTKFVIEFGWSHPDGNVNSDNVLGRYLNALRDLSIYQLVNADYSFGGDNSVDITLNLVCSGFQEMKTLSAAGGYYTNLNTIIDDIQDDVESLINDASSGADLRDLTKSERNKKIKEIRGNLKISTSDLSKNSTIVPFERIGKWKETFDKNDSRAETVKKLLYFLYDEYYGDILNVALEEKEYEYFSDAKSIIDSDLPNAGDVIYAKFESLPHGIDPFRAQVVNSFFKGYGVKGKSVHEIPLIGIDEVGVKVGVKEENLNPAKYRESGVDEHVSLGKIISMFVGYPLSTAGIYDEVQLFFYPVNTQSAAARKHTTASFPIKMSDLREEIDKRAKAGEQSFRNLSVHAFFAILERIVAKQTITAYGLYPEDSEPKTTQNKLDEFLKKSRDEKVSEVNGLEIEISAEDLTAIEDQAQARAAADGNNEEIDDITEKLRESKLIELYETQLAEQISSAREKRLKKVYEAEEEYFGDTFLDKTKFTPVNLAMYFETFAPRNSDKPNDENRVQDFIDLIGSPDKRRDTRDNGKSVEKTILRIHIYDENTNMGPDISLYGSDSINMSKTAIANQYNLSSYTAIKSLLMRRHPTIIHGASSGVVNNISVSSNTSGQLSNILMVEAYEQSINAGTSERKEPDGFDEVVLLPTTVSLDMAGYPMLTRGQQIFIDFGTQTSLDNLYTVKTVDHEIQAGVFKTSAVLVAANQMIVSSFRSRLESLIDLLNTGEDSGTSS